MAHLRKGGEGVVANVLTARDFLKEEAMLCCGTGGVRK